MELRVYYDKIREVESRIVEEFAVIVSHATAGGGKAGILNEVVRRIAAKLIVDGLARLATQEEAAEFLAAQAEARRLAEQREAASKVQFAVLSSDDLSILKSSKSKQRG